MVRRNLSPASSKGLYSYSTNTYDGDADNDSFQTAECSMYSGFEVTYKANDDETSNGEQGGKTLEKGTRCDGDDDDENLSYISEIDYDNEHEGTYIFTKKKNLRLDISIDSTQSLMSMDTFDVTTNDCSLKDSDKVPYLESITSTSTLLESITSKSPLQLGTAAMNGSMISNENEPRNTNVCAPVDWFSTLSKGTSFNRHTKFQSIPIKSTFFYEHQSGIFMK